MHRDNKKDPLTTPQKINTVIVLAFFLHLSECLTKHSTQTVDDGNHHHAPTKIQQLPNSLYSLFKTGKMQEYLYMLK